MTTIRAHLAILFTLTTGAALAACEDDPKPSVRDRCEAAYDCGFDVGRQADGYVAELTDPETNACAQAEGASEPDDLDWWWLYLAAYEGRDDGLSDAERPPGYFERRRDDVCDAAVERASME